MHLLIMNVCMLLNLQTINMLIQSIACQYGYSYHQGYTQNFHNLGMHKYQQPTYSNAYRENSGQNHFFRRLYRPKHFRYQYSESEATDIRDYVNLVSKCDCTCSQCFKATPRPCCTMTCYQCSVQPQLNNVMLVPYPVPIIIGHKSTSSTNKVYNTTVGAKATMDTRTGIPEARITIEVKAATTTEAQTTTTVKQTNNEDPKMVSSTGFNSTEVNPYTDYNDEFETISTSPYLITDTYLKLLKKSVSISKRCPDPEICVTRSTLTLKTKQFKRKAFAQKTFQRPTLNPEKKKTLIDHARRQRSNWLPKFGIVQIPKELAMRMMAKLEHDNSIQSENLISQSQRLETS